MAKFNVKFNRTNKKLEISAGFDFNSGDDAILRIVSPTVLLYENAGWDTDDFSAVDVDESTDLSISLPLNNDGDIVAGNYQISAKVSDGVSVFGFLGEVEYCYDEPTPDLSMTYDCYSSSLTAKDNTDYDINVCGSVVSPVEKDFTLTYGYPENIDGGSPSDVVTTSSNTITISPIYTDISTLKLEAYVMYEIPGADGDFEGYIYDYVYGYDTIEVECDDCICEMYSCLKQLITQWMNAIGKNAVTELKLQTQVIKLNALYNKYRIARQCGNTDEVQGICAEIKAAIDLYGCTCCDSDDDDGYATEVVPVGGTVASGDGAEILFTDTDPVGSLGDDGDIAIQTADGSSYSEGDVFKKESGSWVYQLNITGDSGADGVSSGNVILSDYSETTVNTDTTDVIKIELPYGDVNKLRTAGDRILLRFWALASKDLGSGSQIEFSSPTLDTFTFDLERTEGGIDGNSLYFELEFTLLENYGSSADTGMSGKVNFSGEYNDAKNISDKMINAGVGGTEQINVSLTKNGGTGYIEFQGYDMTYFKAIY